MFGRSATKPTTRTTGRRKIWWNFSRCEKSGRAERPPEGRSACTRLVPHPREWRFLGAVVPGYPFLHPLEEDFWEQFWKLYDQHREPMPKEPPSPT